MLRKLLRALDLAFVFSEKAQQAHVASRVWKVAMEAIYDGGLNVTASELLPEFHQGAPTKRGPCKMIVGRLDTEGSFTTLTAVYIPDVDSFRFANNIRKRDDNDYWMPYDDFPAAFDRATDGAKLRKRR